MPVPPPPPRTRRAVVRAAVTGGVGVLAGGLLTGCELPALDPEDGSTPGLPGADPSDAADPDVRLLTEVRSDLRGTAALVGAVLEERPALRAQARPFDRLHTRHLAALEIDGADREAQTVPRARVRGTDAAALDRLRAVEGRCQRTLANASVVARSGPLAALLASMSAAVAQQLAVTDGGRS